MNFPNSNIKIKYGKCIDCSDNEPEKRLTAKRCLYHYHQHRAKESALKPNQQANKARKERLDTFYANEILRPVKRCENCDAYISELTRLNIAHILPKSHFHTIECDPKNIVILCWQDHWDYDNMESDWVKGMPVYPILCERVKLLLPLLTPDELRRIPSYFKHLL